MRKQDIPFNVNLLTPETTDKFLEQIKAAKVSRVFLCGGGNAEFYFDDTEIEAFADKCNSFKQLLKKEDIEVGLWLNGFGHGISSPEPRYREKIDSYQKLAGPRGDSDGDSVCPLDKAFERDYLHFVKKAAAFEPDIIMIDDDFRLSQRSYVLGCFCPLHMKELQERLGENLSREELAAKIFSGAASKYRDIYYDTMRKTMLDFAARLRQSVDEVNPKIRLGLSMCFDVWDLNGTDGIELAKVLAAENKPFLRTNGAPYWQILGPTWGGFWGDIISAVEYTRMQLAWCSGHDIECIAEGDTYPRPRYTIPANHLEIFDLMLTADGKADSIMKYMFDYKHGDDFEKGYLERHVINEQRRIALDEIFKKKTAPCGVYIYEAMHKVRELEICGSKDDVYSNVLHSFFSRAQYMLSHNAIATVYEDNGGVVAAFGENARTLPAKLLGRGVITDFTGAKILSQRGIDCGYKESRAEKFTEEYFTSDSEAVCFNGIATCNMKCSENAEILSTFLPGGTPAAYRYTNSEGQKFFVLAYDSYLSPAYMQIADYIVSYSRQKQLTEAIEWLGEKPLAAKSLKNPYLYILASKSIDNDAMAVGLFNVFDDGIYSCEIELDCKYTEIKFINCNGCLSGNKVVLEGEIAPFGFAAFEVK